MSHERILLYPLATEKTVKMIERENKLVFVVSTKSSTKDITREFEELFNVKVDRVNTIRRSDGRRVAFIKLTKEYKASDISAKLRIL